MPPPKETIIQAAMEVDGLLSLLTDPIDEEVLAPAADRLRVISQMAVGVDNIDTQAATRLGIPVGHTPGVLTEATADMAFSLLMSAARRISEGIAKVRDGRWRTWEPMGLLGADVWGAALGIIGLGRIGSAVARRATGFSMQILYHDRERHLGLEDELGVEYRDLDSLLRDADFVSLHCALGPDTVDLIDERALRLMKPTAILVNTSRGPVINHVSLLKALREGWIAHAALDVTDPEPIPADHPLVSLPNCTIVPHIASATVSSRNRMAIMAAENLLAGIAGKQLPYCANPSVYQTRKPA
jgi:lactate dehydrogenase-like 2-hydroxyacid dehydrogenase